jgi:hypothetical protein
MGEGRRLLLARASCPAACRSVLRSAGIQHRVGMTGNQPGHDDLLPRPAGHEVPALRQTCRLLAAENICSFAVECDEGLVREAPTATCTHATLSEHP